LTNAYPEELEVSQGKDFHFIFIVDRSGSMGGARIEQTKEALQIFIQSLPVGCDFSILSFGT
jgi:von Willebrand factor A domain-containing protein 5